jgi:N-acetylmuramic acid 6-phosphate etherase
MSQNRLASSVDIDTMQTLDLVRAIAREDQRVPAAVAAQERRLALAIDSIADRMRAGGRLVYVGAGTSGRIAMLDASELGPTFGIEPGRVEVIMAGGPRAFLDAVEGAEDDSDAAIEQIGRSVTDADSVVGIAASGTTPFTVAAIKRANMIGALTVGVTSNPASPLASECDVAIVADTGPEIIMGSSRMKSGTAQKLILNTISTGVMIRLGRTYSNLMVDMPATNAKLRRRAVAMVEIAAGVPSLAAEQALRDCDGDVRCAIVVACRRVPPAIARQLLERHRGNLREVLAD